MPRLPWITKDGYLDWRKVPIDDLLRRSLSEDFSEMSSACGVLGAMEVNGRTEAGVYLVGLFHYVRDDLERLSEVVKVLPKNRQTAQLLFEEFYRVKSSNTTRRYLNTVLKSLAEFPPSLVEDGFERLCHDKTFSVRMRAKFEYYLEQVRVGAGNFWA